MKDTQKEQKLEGIGGWLLFPIVGMFVTIGIQLLDLLDTLLFYEIAGLDVLIMIDLLLITLAGLCLYNIFKKNKLARTFGIAFYISSIVINLLIISPLAAIGSLIWMVYFLKSERVENTFIN